MPGATFGLVVTGWEKLKLLFFKSSFQQRLEKHVGAATELNAMTGADQVKRDIYSGAYAKNAALTIAMKGSSRPLVDTGALAGSIIGRALEWKVGEIGSLRKSTETRGTSGRKKAQSTNVAIIVHFGATVPVTDAMRRYFFALAKENPKIKPLSKSTKVIVIPPRPFLESALTPAMQQQYKTNWEAAVLRALRGDP